MQDACTPPHRHRDPLICRNTTSASTTARICTPPRKPHALGNPREEGRQGHPQAPTCESQGHGEGRTYVVTLLLFTMIPRGQVCGEAVKVVVAQARDAGSTVEVRCQVLHVLVVEGEGLPTGDHRPPAVGGRCGRFSFPNVHLGEGDIQLGLGRITSSHGRGETSTHVARSPGGAVGAHELTRGEGESRLGFLFRDGDLRHMLRKNSNARESQ